MAQQLSAAIKRVYENPSPSDGYRILVDRIWPRGVSKDRAQVDWWCKEIAPSTELRKWFNHQPERYPEFKQRYQTEIKANPIMQKLLQTIKAQPQTTLVYSAKDTQHNQAKVLQEYLLGQ